VTARAVTPPVSTRLLSGWLLAGGVLRSVAGRGFARAARRGDRGDRGDVPGWVLVTLMTAGLVLVLWGVARDRLTEVFNNAIDGVMGGVR
jgi:hypothetical protein